MTKDEFVEAILPLSSAYDKPWTADKAKAWFSVFKPFDAKALKDAVARIVLTRKDPWATPNDVLLLLAEKVMGRIPDASEAFARLTEARMVWYPADEDRCRQAREMLDPITLEAVRGIGGFPALFYTENESVIRGQFDRAYERVVRRHVERRVLPNELWPAITGPPTKAISSRPVRAIESQPANLPVAVSTPASERLAERIERRTNGVGQPTRTLSEEEVAQAKSDQAARLAEYQKRKATA